MDIVLAGGLDFTEMDAAMPLIGQEILKNILDAEFETALVNFDALNREKRLEYADDISISLDNMAAYIVSFRAKVVGFYTICNSFLTTIEIARRVREQDANVKIIFGGPHATVTAKACLRELPYVDVVCRGESEKSILPLMRALVQGAPLDSVPGITFRRGSDIVENEACPLLANDELSLYTVYDHGADWQYRGGVALEGGRGCPFSCTFCSTRLFWGQRFRVKPVQTLIAEMDKYNALYGATGFSIQHDIFTADRAHLTEFCETLVARGRPYTWRCSSRIDVLDKSIIELMSRAGCAQIYLGIEAGSPRMQKVLKKNLDLAFALDRVRELVSAKIYVTASFIYGFLEETEDDFLATLDIMEKLFLLGARSVQLHRFFPLPATEEALKVSAITYFDENDVDLSIFNRRAISDEGRALIRSHKELFLQFYAFHSPVREKYPWIEAVPLLLSTVAETFYETGKFLIRRFGMAGLYARHEPIFREICMAFSDIAFAQSFNETFPRYLARIVEAENDPLLSELFRFERTLIGYATSGVKEPKTAIFALDIPLAQKCGVYERRDTRIMFWRETKTGALRTTAVPPDIELE